MIATCSVIQDLLPLYVENLTSPESNHLIEEHIDGCPECTSLLKKMSQPEPLPKEIDTGAFLKIKSALRRKKQMAGLLTFLLTSIFLIAGFFFLTSPQYLPYSQDLVKITESPDGTVFATFGEKARRLEIEQTPNSDSTSTKNEYSILAWTSLLDEWMGKGTERVILVNPKGEDVDSVWYVNAAQLVSEDRTAALDTLLLGRPENGGRMTLPRLFLNAYLLFTSIGLVLCAGLLFLFRKRAISRNRWRIMSFLLLSYLVGHLLIKGFTGSSYQPVRDFSAILLVAIPLFIALQLVYGHYREKTQGTGTHEDFVDEDKDGVCDNFAERTPLLKKNGTGKGK